MRERCGVKGPRGLGKRTQSLAILGRTLRLTDDGLECEAFVKHRQALRDSDLHEHGHRNTDAPTWRSLHTEAGNRLKAR